ncbi:hypothetical protein OAG34_00385, partial [bacterium]|nr:hypothetical protein [bacterium]
TQVPETLSVASLAAQSVADGQLSSLQIRESVPIRIGDRIFMLSSGSGFVRLPNCTGCVPIPLAG